MWSVLQNHWFLFLYLLEISNEAGWNSVIRQTTSRAVLQLSLLIWISLDIFWTIFCLERKCPLAKDKPLQRSAILKQSISWGATGTKNRCYFHSCCTCVVPCTWAWWYIHAHTHEIRENIHILYNRAM